MFLAIYLEGDEPIMCNVEHFKPDTKKHKIDDIHIIEAKRILGFEVFAGVSKILIEGSSGIVSNHTPYSLYQAFKEAVKPQRTERDSYGR